MTTIAGHVDVSFTDRQGWSEDLGATVLAIMAGDERCGPFVALSYTEPRADQMPLSFAHAHPSDNWRISVRGTTNMGHDSYEQGQFRFHDGGVPYASDNFAWGPDGGFGIIVFADRRGFAIRPVKESIAAKVSPAQDAIGAALGIDMQEPCPGAPAIATTMGPTERSHLDGGFDASASWDEIGVGVRMAAGVAGEPTCGPVLVFLDCAAGSEARPEPGPVGFGDDRRPGVWVDRGRRQGLGPRRRSCRGSRRPALRARRRPRRRAARAALRRPTCAARLPSANGTLAGDLGAALLPVLAQPARPGSSSRLHPPDTGTGRSARVWSAGGEDTVAPTRMLFTCRPLAGHFEPLLPLAAAAQIAGHAVAFATGAPCADRARRAGFDAFHAGRDEDFRADWAPRFPGFADLVGDAQRRFFFTEIFANLELVPRADDLDAIVDAWRPDLIVHEVAELAGPLVGTACGIPYVDVSYGTLVGSSVLQAAGEAAAPHWRARGLEPHPLAGLFRHLYVDTCPPALQSPEIASVAPVQRLRPAAAEIPSGDSPDWFDRLEKSGQPSCT